MEKKIVSSYVYNACGMPNLNNCNINACISENGETNICTVNSINVPKNPPIKTKIPAFVTTVSCVGICSENYPLSYGNYFSMPCKYIDSFLGTSVCNFNYENFKEATKRFLTDNQVEVTLLENKDGHKFIAITDERIPQDWYKMWSESQGYCNGGIASEEWQQVVNYLGNRFTNLE